MENIIIGSHVGFKKNDQLVGSIKEALSYGANTFMIYTGAPQNTIRSNIDEKLTNQGLELLKKNKIDIDSIIVHAPYIVNLASDNSFTVEFLEKEIKRVEKLGLKKIVVHPGNYLKLTKDEAIKNIIDNLNQIIDEDFKIQICLETMAGKGTEIGSNFDEIKKIIDGIRYKQFIKVCLDTCHLNDSGYDLNDFDKVLADFDNIIGLNKLACVHINDSKNKVGENKDRHENFGLGTIGFDNLIKIIYHPLLKNIPKILETPYVTQDDLSKEKIYPPYKHEIDMIKSKKINLNLIEDIRNYYK